MIKNLIIICLFVLLALSCYSQTFVPRDSFRIDIGTNLNLLDGISPTGLYANIRTFVPGLISFKKNREDALNPKFGLHAGIYANRIFSDTTIDKSRIFNTIENLNASDTSSLLSTTYALSENRTIENFGLYFNPFYEIASSKNAAVYVGVNLEVARRRESDNRSFLKTNSSILEKSQNLNQDLVMLPNESDNKIIFEGFIGFNLPILYKLDDVKFTFIPGFGYAISPLLNKIITDFRFDVIHTKTGLSIGGDVRGIIPDSGSPRMNVYVSKAFTFSDLTKYKK